MSRYHILCVEDEELSQEVLVEFLSDLDNVEISTANGGLACLESVKNNRPDLILLDIKMPIMNGFEVCKILKASAETVDIPVIFLSGLAGDNEFNEAMLCGGEGYLTKPFSMTELLSVVTMQMKKSRKN